MANKKLKKGELLFSEGDPSKSMFFIQKGTIRLFKKKGNSPIELGTLHGGEVIGEMGFLDGGPRSASAEALHDTELVEITNDKMQEQAKAIPSWLLVLLKTVVNRLRSANTKIKQLETASTALTYGRDGATREYAFLTTYDVLKVCTSLLLVAARSAEKDEQGAAKVKMGAFQRYCHQIMGEHMSKATEMFDVLQRNGLLKMEKTKDAKGAERIEIYATDLDFLENFIVFVNEENIKDPTKKMSFSKGGMTVMSLIAKSLSEVPADADGLSTVNMASIIEKEKAINGGKDPYLPDDFKELVRNKVATELSIQDSKNMTTKVSATAFTTIYRMFCILKDVEAVNAAKRSRAA